MVVPSRVDSWLTRVGKKLVRIKRGKNRKGETGSEALGQGAVGDQPK